MSSRKSVNLTKLKQKIDDKKQETISKFFSTKCHGDSMTNDVIEIEDDSPAKTLEKVS